MDGMNPNHKKENNNMRAVIIPGVAIGLALALGLFLITSSRSTPRPAVTPTATVQLFTPTKVLLTQTVTPAPFQFDQVRAVVGDPAPYFTLNDLEGEPVDLKDFVGKPIIINLWATWCKPCEYEMPGLEEIYRKYRQDGLVVLAIDQTEMDDKEEIDAFVEKYELSFPVLLDKDSYVSTTLYGMRGLPMSFFIDSDFVLRRIQVGAMLPEVIEEYTQEILPKK